MINRGARQIQPAAVERGTPSRAAMVGSPVSWTSRTRRWSSIPRWRLGSMPSGSAGVGVGGEDVAWRPGHRRRVERSNESPECRDAGHGSAPAPALAEPLAAHTRLSSAGMAMAPGRHGCERDGAVTSHRVARCMGRLRAVTRRHRPQCRGRQSRRDQLQHAVDPWHRARAARKQRGRESVRGDRALTTTIWEASRLLYPWHPA